MSSLTQIPLLMAANGLNLTQIPQISRFCTPGVKSHGCFTAALAPLGSHRFNGFNKKTQN